VDVRHRSLDRSGNHGSGFAGEAQRCALRCRSAITPRHDAAYWDAATVGFDFSEADQVPPALFNRVLWTGLKGDKPYPEFERTR